MNEIHSKIEAAIKELYPSAQDFFIRESQAGFDVLCYDTGGSVHYFQLHLDGNSVIIDAEIDD